MMVRPCYYVLELGPTLKAVCFPVPLTDPGWKNQNSPRLPTEPLDTKAAAQQTHPITHIRPGKMMKKVLMAYPS